MYTHISQPSDVPEGIEVADRRRSDRVPTCLAAWISGEQGDRSSAGRHLTVVDLSMHGVGLRDPDQGLRVGAIHWLVVNGNAMRMSCRIRIVSCRDHDEGGCIIGASFF